MKIMAICGSLRKDSYNRALLKIAQEVAPKGVTIEIVELAGIPVFNQDEEESPPKAVKDFKNKIKKADAILISTPEYNYSIPGPLMNAIDTASRPYGENVWDGKVVGLMGASMGMQGTSRAQLQLRQAFVYLNIHTLNKPEVMIGVVHEKFDKNGRLIDPKTKAKVAELVEALVDLVKEKQGSD